MFRLAYIVTHPIQYQAPLLRLLANSGDVDLDVFFLSDLSLHLHHERAFNQAFQWDVPLTEGYRWQLLPRWVIGTSTALRPHWPVAGLYQRLRAGRFDAVWVHGWGHTGLRQALHAAYKFGLPILMRGESTPDAASEGTWRRRLRDAYCQRLFQRVAAFMWIGSPNREFYQQFGVADERLFLMPYAVDNQWFQTQCRQAASTRSEMRHRMGLQPGRRVILYAGKLIPVKATGDLLTAYLHAFRGDDPARPYLLFAGDGPLRSELETQAGSRAGVDVHFLGFRNQSELPALYDLCDVFVLPSHFEPWGLVVNEVMNAAKPVIVSDRVGAAPDLVTHGLNGWIYPHRDVTTLAGYLQEACNAADLRLMGQQSLRRISTWDFEADRKGLLTALEAVCRRRVGVRQFA